MEPVMQVPSRGTNLQGTFQSAVTPAPGRQLDVQVDLRGVDWLQFKGKSSSILTPQAALGLFGNMVVIVMNLNTVLVTAVLANSVAF